MSAVANIKFNPGDDVTPARRKPGTYSMVDNAVVEYLKSNGSAASRVLATLAERANFKQVGMTVSEIVVETRGLGKRAVEKALRDLEGEGFAQKSGKFWEYVRPVEPGQKANGGSQNANSGSLLKLEPGTKANSGSQKANGGSQNANSGSLFVPKNADQDNEFSPLKEEGRKEEIITPSSTTFTELNTPPRSPDLQMQEPLRSVAATGLLELWGEWVQLGRLVPATQKMQLADWQRWIAQGHAEILRQEASYIIGSGGYNFPAQALKTRMAKEISVRQADASAADELHRAYGEPQCQPGEVRQAPDGKKFTVAYVEYGIVFWEETNSPNMIRDDQAARWPVLEVNS